MSRVKKITPSDLRAQAQELIDFSRMPSLADVLKAVLETREKYRPLILAARTKSEVR